jgi:hypothetical protein
LQIDTLIELVIVKNHNVKKNIVNVSMPGLPVLKLVTAVTVVINNQLLKIILMKSINSVKKQQKLMKFKTLF